MRARLLVLLVACHGDRGSQAPAAPDPLRGLPAAPGPHDADGEDDGNPAELGPTLAALARAPEARFVAVAAPPAGSHPRVCDLRGFAGDVFVSHLAKAIDLDGAQIHRYDPARDRWSLAFDWDRGGAPGRTHEVGGQGIARLRVIDGRLFASDADAPQLGGFGLTAAPFEGYLFVSDRQGRFPALGAGQSPPAGTRLVPLAFHVFDAIVYRGALVASGGTVGERPRFPGGVLVGALGEGEVVPRWRVGEPATGVIRTTFMHRFAGRLYFGLQNNERRTRSDLALLVGDPRDPATPAPILARVTHDGGWLTRRFASGGGTLYWLASGYPASDDNRPATLFASRDGLAFARVPLPTDAGTLHDVAVLGETVYVLAEDGLYRGDPAGFVRIAAAPPGAPFSVFDPFCSAPLERAGDALWAGSLEDGQIFRVEAVSAPADPRASLVEVGGFRLMRFEVTTAQFAAFVAATGHQSDAERAGRGHVWWRFGKGGTYTWRVIAGADWRHPHGPDSAAGPDDAVVQVSARDALAFCLHHGLRLPTEKEWEQAAGPRRYVWGDAPPSRVPPARRGNVGTLACCAPEAADGFARIAPVGSFPAAATPEGIHDLVGNVWEWTSTPSSREPGKQVIKGNGWGNSASSLPIATAHANPPERGLDMVGFRCAADL